MHLAERDAALRAASGLRLGGAPLELAIDLGEIVPPLGGRALVRHRLVHGHESEQLLRHRPLARKAAVDSDATADGRQSHIYTLVIGPMRAKLFRRDNSPYLIPIRGLCAMEILPFPGGKRSK